MAQTRPCDVSPTGDQDKYTVALMNQAGRWWGLDVPLTQIHPSTTNPPIPIQRVTQNSFHAGRGADRYQPEQYNFYDSYNGWNTTPGKYHATLLQKWAKGLRNADFNMPDSNGVHWKPLVGDTKYLAAKFVAGATYTAEKLTLLIRRKVPAGTVDAPGTFTAVVCNDDGTGKPGGTIATVTVDSSTITDVVSEYYVWTLSAAITSGTTYHIKVFGGASDRDAACWEIAVDPSPSVQGHRSTSGTSWTITDYNPYFRLTDADLKRQFKPFIWDGCLYVVGQYDDGATASKLYLNGNRGRATGAQTSTTLKDTDHGTYTAAFPTNVFQNSYIRIIRGTGRGQIRQITSNNGDSYVVSPAWAITPVHGDSEYVIYSCDTFVEVSGLAMGVITGEPKIQNGIVYFPQGDSVVIGRMRLDYTAAGAHGWGGEDVLNQNKGYFLETGYDTAKGEPNLWKANQSATSGSTPNASASSVSRASTAPLGVPVPWGTDLTFAAPILCGDNTCLITRIHEHENALYVMKEDSLYVVQNDRALRVKLGGSEVAPDIDNGRAAVTGGDKQLYVAFRNEVYIVSGGGAYPTGVKFNMPSNRTGPVVSLIAAEGWLFAVINGGTNNYSSIMRFSLDTKTWAEQVRSYFPGRRIRNVQWQPCPETRPRLWWDVEGEMMYQEFPVNGVRPYDDKEIKYQHETTLTLPTIDLGTTDPKHFAVLTVTSQGLAQVGDTESGHYVVVECQTDNDIGTEYWEHVDYIRLSPSGEVRIDRGNKRMIRPRLRLISNEAIDPVIIEAVSLTLFTRNRLAHEYSMQFPIISDDEEQNSVDLLMALRDAATKAEPLTMLSRFTLFHNKQVTIADEPRYQLEELEPTNNELEAQVWLKLTEVI